MILTLLAILGAFTFAQDWQEVVGSPNSKEMRIWTDAYLQCMEDMREESYGLSKEFAEILRDSIVYKKLLIDGAIPPPKIYVETKYEKKNGQVVRVEKVYFVPVSYEELMRFEYFRRRLEEKKDRLRRYSGFWIYVKTTNLPKPVVGLYKFIAKREGLSPFVRGEVLVFDVAPTEEDAELIRERLKRKYHIAPAVAEVREGKPIDPALMNLLMVGGLD